MKLTHKGELSLGSVLDVTWWQISMMEKGGKTTCLDYTSVPLYGLFVYLGQSEGEKGESSWLIPGSQNGNLKLYTLKKPSIKWLLSFGKHIQSNSSLINICGSTEHRKLWWRTLEVDNCMATCKLWLGKKQKLLTNCEEYRTGGFGLFFP